MLEEISNGIWKITGESNIYYLSEEDIVIDTGFSEDKTSIKIDLSKVINLKEIKTVIFTHLHYDHIGNYDLFPNATFYTSKQEINDLNKDKFGTILLKPIANKFNITIKDIKELKLPEYLQVIETPGHTKGSICIYDSKRKTLFSGDTLFFENNIGRMDLPTSIPEKMKESLDKLKELDWKVLCPGHDY